MSQPWLDEHYDLYHSPDDGGWYLQRFPKQDTSQIFSTREEALKAWRNPDTIEWS